jgi:hypothetical protein
MNSLEIRENIQGEDNFDIAFVYNNVGIIYDALGNFEKALNFKFKSLKIRKKVLADNNYLICLSY